MALNVPLVLGRSQSSSTRVPLTLCSAERPALVAPNFLKRPTGHAHTLCFGLVCLAAFRSAKRSPCCKVLKGFRLRAAPSTVASKGSEAVPDEEVPQAESATKDWHGYSQLGTQRAAAGDHDAALEAFEAAQGCLEQLGDTKTLEYAKTLMNIGVLHAEANRNLAALKSYMVAKEIFADLKRLKSKNGARLLANIAIAKFQAFLGTSQEESKAGDPPPAEEVISTFASALEMFKQQGLLRSKEGVRLLIQAGKAKEENGDFAAALEDYKAARATLEEVGAIGSKMGIEVLEKMSDVQFELDDLEGAEANLVMAADKTLAKGLLDSLEGAQLLQKLGDLQTELNGYQEALTSYQSARQILEDRNALKGFAAACLLANMATLEAETTSPVDGLKLFEEAKMLFVEADALHTEEGADLLVNLAAQCLKAGEVDSALQHLKEAKEVFSSQSLLEDSLAGAKFWMNLGSALMQKESQKECMEGIESHSLIWIRSLKAGEASKAVDTYDMAYAAADVAYDTQMEDLAMLLTKRGCLAVAEVGDLEDALKDHEEARSLAEEHGFLESSLGADILVNMGIAKATEGMDQPADYR
eukprot:Skav226370  [mRNA]  locus=scaffold290:183923:188244:+ [translate_table: standard]